MFERVKKENSNRSSTRHNLGCSMSEKKFYNCKRMTLIDNRFEVTINYVKEDKTNV